MKIYTLQLTIEQLSVISEGLMSVPYGKAAAVVNDINKQLETIQQSEETPSSN